MKSLNLFVEKLKQNLGENLLTILAFGSNANAEKVKNNLNLMVVTNTLSAEDLKAISKPVQKWVKAKNPMIVIMDKVEWYSSFDTYALEYSDIKDNYRLIYGEDLVPNINISKHYLRLACEKELKSLLLKYKNCFLMNIKSTKAMREIVNNVIKTLIVIFRSILRLYDKQVPYRATDIIESVSEILNIDKKTLIKLAEIKYEKRKCKKEEFKQAEDLLIIEIQKILQQVDNMQF